MVSSACVLLKKVLIEAERECRAAALKGSMTHSFTHMGNLLLLLSSPLGWRTSSSDLSLQAVIWALRLELGHVVGNWALWLRFEFRGWDLDLKAGIWAWKLWSGPQGWYLGLEAGIWALSLRQGGWKRRRRRKFRICVKMQAINPFRAAAQQQQQQQQ